ncbi:hypothetical protein FNV43_RR12518 [Rhamnella rubrinervis]|uniref:Uncharacterized protein n=1 Tax=Rhamnella rubrinervis TaxID=2594499 RepID=A0A8K0H7G8_9ROSA|nr:hypothetical protein FNV43_RR12518 [Rhamnella rubrinervis]
MTRSKFSTLLAAYYFHLGHSGFHASKSDRDFPNALKAGDRRVQFLPFLISSPTKNPEGLITFPHDLARYQSSLTVENLQAMLL